MTLGSYTACPPLLRAACDCVAAERAVLVEGPGDYEGWLANALSQDREHGAVALELGRFRAGSALAESERLGTLYRLLSELSMPHFGSTAFLVAPDSNLQKISIAFGDSAFHLGWAELVAGWVLLLAEEQITTVLSTGTFAVDHATLAVYQSYSREAASLLGNGRRCYVEEVGGRYLFHNWRRTAAGSPKRVLLRHQ
jgi:hypothetical protein